MSESELGTREAGLYGPRGLSRSPLA